jgi:hypothetical protein
MRRFILNLSPISYRSTRSFYQLRVHSTMSTSVSRSQPKWHLPAQKETPVLKLQNSLTKTKVYMNYDEEQRGYIVLKSGRFVDRLHSNQRS